MGRLGEFGKTGELGEPGKLGTESGAERRARFLRGEEGAVMRDMRGEERGCEMGHAGKEIWGKGMSGEPVAPAQKEKARLDVCGAITDALPQKNSPQSEGFSI